MRGFILVALLVPLLQLSAPTAFASGYERAVKMLKSGRSFRARAQAAFSLGRGTAKTEDGRRKALHRALSDRHPIVRAAAATSLGHVGSAKTLLRLKKLRRDRSKAVRKQTRRATRRIKRRLAAASPKREQNKLDPRLVEPRSLVGRVDASLARFPSAVAKKLRRRLVEALDDRGDIGDPKLLQIDTRISQLRFRKVSGRLELHCELSLLIVDRTRQNIVGSARASTRVSGVVGHVSRAELLEEALSEVVKVATRDLSGARLAQR